MATTGPAYVALPGLAAQRATGGETSNPVYRKGRGRKWDLGGKYMPFSLSSYLFGDDAQGGNGVDDYGWLAPEDTPNFRPGRMSDPRVQEEFNRYQSAINYFQRIGKPVPQWYVNRRDALAAQGGKGPGEDYNSESFDPNLTTHLRGLERQRKGHTQGPAQWQAGIQNTLAQNQLRNDQQFFDTQVNPGLQSAQGVAQGLVDTPTFDSNRIADMRSQLAAGIKGSEQNRLSTIASIFGVSGGIGQGSPAATALAESVARGADAEVATKLGQLDQDTTVTNRENASSAAQLLSGLSIARQQARQAATSGDRARLYQISDNLAATMEALRASRELRAQQQSAASDAQDAQTKANYIKLGTTAVGSLFGPIGAAIGGAAGSYAAGKFATPKSDALYSGNESGFGSPTSGQNFDYSSIYGAGGPSTPTYDANFQD